MEHDSNWFPETFTGRAQLGFECTVMFGCAIAGLIIGLPNQNNLWGKAFNILVYEMMIATIPASALGLLWAVKMPKWIPQLASNAWTHLIWVFGAFMMFAFGTIVAAHFGLL